MKPANKDHKAFGATHPKIPGFGCIVFATDPQDAQAKCEEMFREHGERWKAKGFRVTREPDYDDLLYLNPPEVVDIAQAVDLLSLRN